MSKQGTRENLIPNIRCGACGTEFHKGRWYRCPTCGLSSQLKEIVNEARAMKYAECALCRRYSKRLDDCRGNGDCVMMPGMTAPSMFKGD